MSDHHDKPAADHPAHAKHEEHPSTGIYVAVWAALIILTFTTSAVAKIDMGPFNVYVALTIAVIKALLVILFFMHVKNSTGITRIYVGAGFFWLLILLFLTLTDYLTRDWLPVPGW